MQANISRDYAAFANELATSKTSPRSTIRVVQR